MPWQSCRRAAAEATPLAVPARPARGAFEQLAITAAGAAVALSLALSAGARAATAEPSPPAARPVVVAGDHATTVAQFDALANRLSGETSLGVASRARLRRRVLEIILAREALWLEGRDRGLDRSPPIATALAAQRGKLLGRRLYEQYVEEPAEPTRSELEKLYRDWDSGEAVRARHILCRDEGAARLILERLRQGESFEELARTESRHAMSAHLGGDMGYMRREQLLEGLRDAVWKAPPGQVIPRPLHSRLGVHVVEVTEHRRRSLEEMRAELAGEVRRRKKRAREVAVFDSLRLEMGLQWHADVAAGVRTGEVTAEAGGSRALATWRDGVLTAGQFIAGVRKLGIRETELDSTGMADALPRLAVQPMLRSLALASDTAAVDAETAAALHQAEVELLANALYTRYMADRPPASEEELRSFWESHRSNFRAPPTLRLQEILVDSRSLADSLASLARAGTDLGDLAATYTQRVWARAKRGDIGEISEASPAYGRLARVARAAELGQIVGPVPSHGGYSVFKVTARKDGEEPDFEAAREAVEQNYKERGMDALIDSLRQVHAERIHIDEAALARTLGGADR